MEGTAGLKKNCLLVVPVLPPQFGYLGAGPKGGRATRASRELQNPVVTVGWEIEEIPPLDIEGPPAFELLSDIAHAEYDDDQESKSDREQLPTHSASEFQDEVFASN